MSAYKPGHPPAKQDELVGFLREEFHRIEQAMTSDWMFLRLQVLHVEPAKVFAGMVVYFDGADYNPGSGEGIYRRNRANNAWVFVG